MKIAISGASGFIGKRLSAFLELQGHQIVPLGRAMFRDNMSDQLIARLSQCEVVINLAGATINRRWTTEYKKELYNSRVNVTRRLVQTINSLEQKPQLFISASAVGYYPTEGCHDDYSQERGEGFLSDLCCRWEAEAAKVHTDTRLVITRFGVVLSPDGGAFKELSRSLKLKMAVAIGPGNQYFPWIDIRDLNKAMLHVIKTTSIIGIINFVAPHQITQTELRDRMAWRYSSWFKLTVPSAVIRFFMGEASNFLTTGQCVIPATLEETGFEFSANDIDEFLADTTKWTVRKIDLSRYMGKWYEIARFENRFERNLTRVTAEYTLLSGNKIRVVNSGYLNGELNVSEGKAYVPDPDTPGKLKVAFFLWFYSDYYILELDEVNYNYVLIGSSKNNYLWILSRTPQLPDDVKKMLLYKAERRGYDISRLLWVKQSEE